MIYILYYYRAYCIRIFMFKILEIKRLECVSLQTLFETEDNSSKCSLLSINQKFSSNDFGQQLQMLQSNQTRTFAAILVEEENAKMAVQLESKANQMASTIVELNNIFKEVTHMTYQQVSLNFIYLVCLVSININTVVMLNYLIFVG